MRKVVTLQVETVVPTETGIWCGSCLLPSAARVTFAVSTAGHLLDIRTYECCFDCGRQNW